MASPHAAERAAFRLAVPMRTASRSADEEGRNHVDAVASNVWGMPRAPLAAFGGAGFPEFIGLA